MAEDLRQLVDHLGLDAVHLTGQDLSGPLTYRLAAAHPDQVRSLTFIETGLPGFGLDTYMDPTKGGAWHFGFFAAPGIPEMLLDGHEREFLTRYAYDGFSEVKDAISAVDVDEFMRTFAELNGWKGSTGLYKSMVPEAPELREIGGRQRAISTMGIGGTSNAGAGDFPRATLAQVADDVRGHLIDNAGHFTAMESPEKLAEKLLAFFEEVDAKY